jgi:hypothetical protein
MGPLSLPHCRRARDRSGNPFLPEAKKIEADSPAGRTEGTAGCAQFRMELSYNQFPYSTRPEGTDAPSSVWNCRTINFLTAPGPKGLLRPNSSKEDHFREVRVDIYW